ncbi:MAG: aldehyde dehydrogenase family protein [Desulfobacterales bacterium]|nr:aldehyde dehydrogenase family protein [Desulfobacterales bacterium]
MIRQPVGVCATIAPFNFPGMIAFWYLPYALACGNTYIVKPSEQVPITMQLIFKLIEQVGFPKGVVNLVNGAQGRGGRHPRSPGHSRRSPSSARRNVAKYIYSRCGGTTASASRPRAGRRTRSIVLPDADMEMATKIIADLAFGCAGQRCLAVSLAVTVGEARNTFTELICDAAASRVGGLRAGCRRPDGAGDQSAAAKARVEQSDRTRASRKEQRSRWMDAGRSIKGYESGYVRPPDHFGGCAAGQRDLPARRSLARCWA